MRKIVLYFILLQIGVIMNAFADDKDVHATIRSFLDQMLNDNKTHMNAIDKAKYSAFADKQTPRATVVMCSDSRVQTEAFNNAEVNDLFVVRNIGNQLRNAYGSVEYGVYFLKTPVLLIVGHSGCGAIKAAMSTDEVGNVNVERELELLNVKSAISLNHGIVKNVHQQVKIAVKKFHTLINDGKLVVIGAVYDFQDTFQKGMGKMIIMNINGERDPEEILKNPYFKDSKNLITVLNK